VRIGSSLTDQIVPAKCRNIQRKRPSKFGDEQRAPRRAVLLLWQETDVECKGKMVTYAGIFVDLRHSWCGSKASILRKQASKIA
jgi:hypothetical protein